MTLTTLHFVAGGPRSVVPALGFNLIDLQTVEQLDELPAGTKGLIWLNENDGVTETFKKKVAQFEGHPKLFGFHLTDEPDPTGKYHEKVSAADLKAESDWIHDNIPGAKTFITLMNMGSFANPSYQNTYNPSNTNIDYFGINPYPVRSEIVDFDIIDKSVAAAVQAGIPKSAIVPVYQAFGGGNWDVGTGGRYVMPTASQMEEMLDRWSKLVPSPAFDFARSWNSQNGEQSLKDSVALQQVFKEHNLSLGSSTDNDGDNSSPAETSGTDILEGTSGGDRLTGDAGDNKLYGKGGHDKLLGGGGADLLVGGTGDDVFAFYKLSDSREGAPDTIQAGDGAVAFERGEDRIDLEGIDANVNVSGNQSFTFGSQKIGGLSLTSVGSDTLVRGNVDSDGAYEFQLLIKDGGLSHTAYPSAEFIL